MSIYELYPSLKHDPFLYPTAYGLRPPRSFSHQKNMVAAAQAAAHKRQLKELKRILDKENDRFTNNNNPKLKSNINYNYIAKKYGYPITPLKVEKYLGKRKRFMAWNTMPKQRPSENREEYLNRFVAWCTDHDIDLANAVGLGLVRKLKSNIGSGNNNNSNREILCTAVSS